MSVARFNAATWREVEAYFDQVLDLEYEQRADWLTQLSVTEPRIAQTLRADGFLEHALPGLPTELTELETSLAGTNVGSYEIERLLGRGGMGEVWLAKRNDGRFEGKCAIKFLDGSPVHRNFARRFHQEGQLLARLVHPNIARLLDAGTTEEGRPFLVLEYVDGERIDHYCEAHRLSVPQRVRLFLDAVAAIAHAHDHLIIHRDLKPSNVLVTREGVVKLLDFGIAKLLSPSADIDAATRTRFEGAMLTPGYAAPEQLLADLPRTATDVYQLGMLLYVLLTGGHPLQMSGSFPERIKRALEYELPRASEFARGIVRKQLRGDLDAILAMALRKDPQERYATAAALREDLLRYLNTEPVSARRGAAWYFARKFIRRHWLGVTSSAAALAGLCAVLVFAFDRAHLATVERDNALDLAQRHQSMSEFLKLVVTEDAHSREPGPMNDLLARTEQLALAKRISAENSAGVLTMLSFHYLAVGKEEKSAELLEKGLQMLAGSTAHDLRAELICDHASVISGMGKGSQALREIAEVLQHPPRGATWVICLQDRAEIAISQDDAGAALQYAQAALEKARSSPGTRGDQASLLVTLGSAYHMNGREREALEFYEQALQQFLQLGRNDTPVVRYNLGRAIAAAGVPKRALQVYEEILSSEAARALDLPAYAMVSRANALYAIGRFAQARSGYQEALQLALQLQDVPNQLASMVGLAQVALEFHDLATAGQQLAQIAEVPGSPSAGSPSGRPWLPLVRGRLALASHDLAEARQLFEQVEANKSNHPAVRLEAELSRVEVLIAAGDANLAATAAQLALEEATALQGRFPYSQRTGRAWLLLGRAQRQLYQDSNACASLTRARRHLENTVDTDHPALLAVRREQEALSLR